MPNMQCRLKCPGTYVEYCMYECCTVVSKCGNVIVGTVCGLVAKSAPSFESSVLRALC